MGVTLFHTIVLHQVDELEGQVTELQLAVDGLEKERDFYFGKLREIEVWLGFNVRLVRFPALLLLNDPFTPRCSCCARRPETRARRSSRTL